MFSEKTVKELQSQQPNRSHVKSKRDLEQEQRYKPTCRPPKQITCKHKDGGLFECSQISFEDIKWFHSVFYAIPKRDYQTQVILSNIRTTEPKRRRHQKRTGGVSTERLVSTQYFVAGKTKKRRVCIATFCKILNIDAKRAQRLASKQQTSGCVAFKQGGDSTSHLYREKKNAVKEFIGNQVGQESHYSREKSCKIYLNSALSVKKLWEQYDRASAENLKVKYWWFHRIFTKEFNLSFKSPATDVCSTCLCFDNRLKTKSLTEVQKRQLKEKWRVHKNKAAMFFKALKRPPPRQVILTADCQKGEPLPRVTDGAAYYSRQLTFNHFCVVEGSSHNKLNKSNVTSFTWTEENFKKGSNEIWSCMFHKMNQLEAEGKLNDADVVKICMDNTPATNKNQCAIACVSYWLVNRAPNNIRKVTNIHIRRVLSVALFHVCYQYLKVTVSNFPRKFLIN